MRIISNQLYRFVLPVGLVILMFTDVISRNCNFHEQFHNCWKVLLKQMHSLHIVAGAKNTK